MSNKIYIHQPFAISGYLQNYQWGQDAKGLVGKLSKVVASNNCYAELWYGTHRAGPSTLSNNSQQSLLDIINSNPEQILGAKIFKKFGGQLPFLFKFLAIAQPLSIQVHPDLAQAVELHKSCPSIYTDPYPKPEVGLALSNVNLLYGFRAPLEILSCLHPDSDFAPELPELVGNLFAKELADQINNEQVFLKKLVSKILNSDKTALEKQCQKLYKRITSKKNPSSIEHWLIRLSTHYPAGDVGIFLFYLLNLIEIPAGNYIYIKPGTVHAYLTGEIAECMAASNNVVRVGLTNKHIDQETLLNIANFKSEELNSLVLPFESLKVIRPADQDFFELTVINNHTEQLKFETSQKAELLICLSGKVNIFSGNNYSIEITSGMALFIPATVPTYELEACDGITFRVCWP